MKSEFANSFLFYGRSLNNIKPLGKQRGVVWWGDRRFVATNPNLLSANVLDKYTGGFDRIDSSIIITVLS